MEVSERSASYSDCFTLEDSQVSIGWEAGWTLGQSGHGSKEENIPYLPLWVIEPQSSSMQSAHYAEWAAFDAMPVDTWANWSKW